MHYVIHIGHEWRVLAGGYITASRALQVRDELRSKVSSIEAQAIVVMKIVE